MTDPSSPIDRAATDRLLTTTRAVRRRLDLTRPVELDVVKECIAVALQAPSAANAQRWRWMVITDADKRHAIAGVYRRHGEAYLRSLAATARDAATRRSYDSATYLATVLDRVPVLVIPCLAVPVDLSSNRTAASAYGSIMPAVWSFLLALRSRGLGSVITTLHLYDEAAVGALLGIPEDATQVCLLPVAYTLGRNFKPAQRNSVEHVTYWNEWGATR
jgi:nitroreductase